MEFNVPFQHKYGYIRTQVRSPPTTSGLGTEWDYSGRKRKDGPKKKTGKANEKSKKVKKAKDEGVNRQGRKKGEG